MKRTITIIGGLLLLVVILWACNRKTSTGTTVNQPLPQDVLKSDTVSIDTFKTWFASKAVTLNGAVTPANSIAFTPTNNQAFYQWSERMFLWVTSPTPTGGPVLASDEFYTVSPPDSTKHRVLIPHTAGTVISMSPHIAKVGPAGLPVIKDKDGNLREIEEPAVNAQNMVKDDAGKATVVDHITATGKTLTFFDKAGKVITHPHALLQHKGNPGHFVQRFVVNKKPVFLDENGNIVDTEEGQATGDALMAQNGSLVYYLTLVNDVYAEYLNMVKTVAPEEGGHFPVTAIERDSIVAYALKHKVILKHPNTLAMELKTSWVEAASLGADSSNYVLITAIIPTYNNSNPKKWIPTGQKTTRMAMVGIHIAGSLTNHPEMAWATFEHQNNTPDTNYAYLNTKKDTIRVAKNTTGNWLFAANGATDPYNVSHIVTYDTTNKKHKFSSTDTLFANSDTTISPSNSLRTLPWGSFSRAGKIINQQDTTAAAANSEIISINNSIRGMLAAGDIRANYLFGGAVWTPSGTAPTGKGYNTTVSSTNPYGQIEPGVTIGTSVLANSTMETYFQSDKNSCFTCHSTNTKVPTLSPFVLSHVFSEIDTFKKQMAVIQSKKKK